MNSPTLFSTVFFVSIGLIQSPPLLAGGLDHPSLSSSDFPVALAAIEKGKLLEIVAADSSGQIALDENGNSIEFPDTKLILAKGQAFAEGKLEIAASSAHILDNAPSSKASAYRSGQSDGTLVEVTLVPTRDYSNVVMAAVFFTFDGRREISAESIGDLQAGRETHVSLMNPEVYDHSSQQIEYSLLFFSDEGEIVSEFRRRSSLLVAQMFEEFYREFVHGYALANEEPNRPVSLVHRYPMDFEGVESAASKQSGSTFFTLSVDETGLVSRVDTDDSLPVALRERCERSLNEWLFLPKISEGFAAPSKVRVPVHWD